MSKIVLNLLTKRGCSICDQAKTRLEGFRKDYAFSINNVDVNLHRPYERFKNEVPVVLYGDEVVSKILFDEKKIREILDKYAQRDDLHISTDPGSVDK